MPQRRASNPRGQPTCERHAAGRPTLREYRRTMLRSYLQELIRETGGNLARAARTAGVERSQLYRLLYKHGLREPGHR